MGGGQDTLPAERSISASLPSLRLCEADLPQHHGPSGILKVLGRHFIPSWPFNPEVVQGRRVQGTAAISTRHQPRGQRQWELWSRLCICHQATLHLLKLSVLLTSMKALSGLPVALPALYYTEGVRGWAWKASLAEMIPQLNFHVPAGFRQIKGKGTAHIEAWNSMTSFRNK